MSATVAEHFERQALACEGLGSPFTGRICRTLIAVLDRGTETGRTVLDWPGDPAADALALRLCGGLHALVLDAADAGLARCYPPHDVSRDALAGAVADALSAHDGRLAAGLALPPQTNEIARSAMLLPGFMTIARECALPLAVSEIGASAGLNLNFDRFHYTFGDRQWGDPAAAVRLEAELRGGRPPLDADLSVVDRAGADIAPIDVAEPAGRTRLRSYVWPDQERRLQRLGAAIALAGEFPVMPARMDAAEFLARRLSVRRTGSVFVLYHSIMWQYMPPAMREAIATMLAGHGEAADAPLAWLRMEPKGKEARHATLSLTLWPGGATRDLARCDYHGRWIEWLEPYVIPPAASGGRSAATG